MASSFLMIYEPLDGFGEKRDYWRSYIAFYERYWGGPTSPYGVWFGQEYESFRKAFAQHIEIEERDIEECLFMKDEEGRYLISPFGSGENPYLLTCENRIPEEWFILFQDEERDSFYTHWAFAGIHYDTKISRCTARLEKADKAIRECIEKHGSDNMKLSFFHKMKEIQAGIYELQAWLSGFDPSSYLILNYGEVCSFIHPYTLENERSVAEMWHILSLMNEDRIKEARSALSIIVEKWEDIRKKASGDIDKTMIQ